MQYLIEAVTKYCHALKANGEQETLQQLQLLVGADANEQLTDCVR
jgi:hypothetical protein